MKTYKLIIITIIYFASSLNINAQEKSVDIIEKGKKIKTQINETPFKYGGALNVDFRFNNITGINRRTDPFNLRINGTSYFSFYGVRTTFNINYSDGRTVHRLNRPNVKLPSFAYLGMSPTYKWAKIHLGYRSMQFSPYTLSGNNFYGAGFELSPKKYRLSGFYGRLQRARQENVDALSSIDPNYRRIGWGLKTGFVNNGNEIYLILFSAKDDPNSIEQPIIRNDVLPAENTVLSVKAKKKISKIISLDIDYAWSALTRDSRSEKIENIENSILFTMGGIFTPKISTGFHKALNTGLNFNFPKLKIDLRHERIDPGYQSLGALFFNNDFERLSTGISRPFFKNRLNLNTRLGFQRNNLSGLESNSMRRFVANINSNFIVNERINIFLNYSNFSNTIERNVSLVPIIDIDSIALTQVNRNFQLGGSFIAGKSKRSIFNSFISYQVFNSITNDIVDRDREIENIIGNLSHTYQFKGNKGNIGNSLIINYNLTSFSNITSLVPSHSFAHHFMDKKLKLQFGLSNAFLFQDGDFSRHIFQIRFRNDFKLSNKFSMGIQANFTLLSNGQNSMNNNFNETGVRLRSKYKF